MPLTADSKLERRAQRRARTILVNRHKAHTQTNMIALGWLDGFNAGKRTAATATKKASPR